MTGNNTYRDKGRAISLAVIMVLSMVAVTATFAGATAAQSVDSAERTISDQVVEPGDTVQVEVEATVGSAGDGISFEEAFSPNFAGAEFQFPAVTVNGQGANADPSASGDDLVFASVDQSFTQGDTVTLYYEVDIPESATAGTEYSIDGTVDLGGNSVAVSGPDTITVGSSDGFTVSNLNPQTASVSPGQQLTVTATVTNNGDSAGSTEARFTLDGQTQATTQTSTLDPGQSETVSFSVNAPSSSGSYEHGVETDDSSQTGTLTVNAPGDASVTITDQPSLNGQSVLVDQASGDAGQQLAIWSVDEDGNPDEVLGSTGLPSSSAQDVVVSLDTPIEQSQTLVAAVHNTQDASQITASNLLASDTASISYVEADATIRDSSRTPTQWQGQVILIEGDFEAGNDYQVRAVDGSGEDRAVGSLVREVRAFNDDELIVFTNRLDANLFITETEQERYSNGDELASTLDNEPGFGFEIAVQTLFVENVQPQVVRNNSFIIGEIDSIRSTYDLAVTAVDANGNRYPLTTLTDVADRETNVAIAARTGDDPLPIGEYTLLFNATDTTASASAGLEVTEQLDEEVTIASPDPTDDSFTRGDIIPIELEFQGTDTGTLTFGDRTGPQNVEVNVTVVDSNGDGTATIYLNTFQVGDGPVQQDGEITAPDNHRNHGFFTNPLDTGSEIQGDAIAHGASLDISGGSQGGAIIFPQGYDLRTTAGDESFKAPDQFLNDNSIVRIQEGQVDGVTEWTAPGLGENSIRDLDPEFASDVGDLVERGIITPADGAVAEEDYYVLQIEATGLEGLMHEAVLQDSDLRVADFLDRQEDHFVTEEFFAARNLTDRTGQFDLLDFDLSTVETVESFNNRVEANAEVNPVRLNIEQESAGVLAGTDESGNLNEYFIPLRMTPGEELVLSGDGPLAPGFEFNTTVGIDPSAADQDNVPANDRLYGGPFVGYNNWNYIEAVATVDTADPILTVPQEDGVEITGTTNVAAGTNLTISMATTPAEDPPFFKQNAEVFPEYQEGADSPNTWSITEDFAEFNVSTNFEVSIRRTGAAGKITPGGEDVPGVIGEVRAVQEFTFNDQRSGGQSVVVDSFQAPYDSVIQIQDSSGDVLGTSNVIPASESPQNRIAISLDEDLASNQEVTAVALLAEGQQEYGDDAATQTAEITIEEEAPATFQVNSIDPEEASIDEPAEVTVTATIENTGDESGTQDVRLTVGGNELDSQEVSLDGGEQITVDLTVPADALEFGNTYFHTVQTDDDSLRGALSVAEEPDMDTPTPEPTDTPTPDDSTPTDTDDDDGAGFGIVVALMAFLGAALLAVRRQTDS